ncbi:transcription factor S [Natronomonas sp. EA1]|uniref:transcription factor S n=1 Tax=Natronomonas sp. EA1 TaxID=3421655 RepID=UPI003EBC26DE
MQFCDECGSMMHTNGDYWECRSCGHEELRDAAKEEGMTTKEGRDENAGPVVIESSEDIGLPTTKAKCPECGNDRAFYEMKQIRSADESETRFFTCTECDKKWREDDH